MCGIAGFTHRDRSADRNSIARVTASLFHRGPDQQNVYCSPDICLGAVRLKIIDMNGGDQPLISPDGSTVVAFNGEIYNHRELRGELEQLGCKFRSHCDTEVVLHAFRQWDLDCLRRFRGMFALAVWSQPDKRLVLARDRMGIKPLYYYLRGSELHFGSELKAIFEHPDIPRHLDCAALQDFLALNYVPGSRTLIQGITKLAPGHFIEHRAGQTHLNQWWKLEFHPDPVSLHDAEHRLDHLLKESVREHMGSDVPLGIWSSGGLDSSTILHYASEATSKRLKTFSVGFQARCCDESRYFREVASRYGTEHHEVELAPGPDLISAVEDFAYYSDEPGADAGALPVWFLSKMTAQHVTVALSGDGGDELFGGYLTYMADKAARPLRAVPAPFRRASLGFLQQALPVSKKKISFEYKLKRWMEGSLLHPDKSHLFWNGAFSDSERRALTGVSPGLGPDLFGHLPPAAEIGFLNRYMLLDQQNYLPSNILYKVDRMSMAHSVEARPAFLDHRIVEFAASLPENLKIRGSRQKYLLKHLMRDKLPLSVLTRSKKGFDIPTHDWFRGFLKPLLLDTLTQNAVESTGIFNFDATHALIRDHMERRRNVGYHLWSLLTLFLWLKKWGVETAPRQESCPEFSEQVLVATS